MNYNSCVIINQGYEINYEKKVFFNNNLVLFFKLGGKNGYKTR